MQALKNKSLWITIAMILVVFLCNAQEVKAADTRGQLDKPTISLSHSVAKGFGISGSTDRDAVGYQIKYSRSATFTTSSSKFVTGTRIGTRVTGLTADKKYYVKVRPYKLKGTTKVYGKWSDVKTIISRVYYYAYTTNATTKLYKEQTSKSTSISIWYNTRVSVYSQKVFAKGTWVKVKYNGSYYYIWVDKDGTKLTTKKNNYNYTSSGNSEDQQAVVDCALDIYKNCKTKYVQNAKGQVVNGAYQFDCSGFADYVYHSVLQKDTPMYRLPHFINKIDAFTTMPMYNNGLPGEYNMEVVCEGGIDYSLIKPGDLICFKLKGALHQEYRINHCGIYLGGKEFIHSTVGYGGVCIMPLQGSYESQVVSVIRPIPDVMEPANISVTLPVGTKMYSDERCKEELGYVSVPAGSKITVKYTRDLSYDVYGNTTKVPKPICYATYRNGDGKLIKGFIYDYKTKLNM